MIFAEIIGWLVALMLGLGWGGFITMAVDRLPRGVPWVGKHPYCALCDHALVLADYWPIISYFRWRGVCRYCGGSFPANHGFLATEIGAVAVSLMGYGRYGWSDLYLLVSCIGYTCVVLAVIDASHRRIPASLLALLLALVAVYRTLLDGTLEHVILGGVIGGALGVLIRTAYYAITTRTPQLGYAFLQSSGVERFQAPGLGAIGVLSISSMALPWSVWAYELIASALILAGWRIAAPSTSPPLGGILAGGLIVALLVGNIYS